MLQNNNALALLLIVLCCGCGDASLCGNNQCLALLLIVLCCGGPCGSTGTGTFNGEQLT